MRISAALPHGVSALLGDSARARRRLEAALAARLETAGFEEVVLPIVDYLEPYEAILTPAGRRELYQLIDRDGELLALRADFTPMLARLLAPRLSELGELGAETGESGGLPLRLFYRGDVVRFQEERPGRLREFYQLGAELVGEAGAAAEERMLRLFLDLVTAEHSGEVDVVLGFAGALDSLLASLASRGELGHAALAAALGRRDREALRRAGSPVLLRIAERGVPDDPADLGPAAGRFAEVTALRDRLAAERPALRFTVDLAELAHLEGEPSETADAALGGRSYYDGLVFRAYLGGSSLPVGGGGRYDRLYRTLGADVPAVGFSLGIDRLANAAAPAGGGEGP